MSNVMPTMDDPDPAGMYSDVNPECFTSGEIGGERSLPLDEITYRGVTQAKNGRNEGVLSDFTGLLGHGHANVYVDGYGNVELYRFGWSPERDYPEEHIYHPSNR